MTRLGLILLWLLLPWLIACTSANNTAANSSGTSNQLSQEPKESLPRPAHHTDDGFRNLHIEPISKGPFTFLKMKYFSDEVFADQAAQAHLVPIAEPDHRAIVQPQRKPQVTWLGHSTFLIQYRGLNILTDPILSDRASPVSFAGPKRLTAKPIKMEDLPAIDYVVISHNHYDHLDQKTITQLAQQSVILVPLKLKEWLVDEGLSASHVIEFDWWDRHELPGLVATATPSQHWSARGLFDRYQTLWAAWHLQIDDFTLWFGGDTGYNDVQFKQVSQRLNPVDLGLIPIGAYAPRWFMSAQHVNPAEAVKIHQDIAATKSIGMHWGTFQLTSEAIMEPVEHLALALAETGLDVSEFFTLAIGETYIHHGLHDDDNR